MKTQGHFFYKPKSLQPSRVQGKPPQKLCLVRPSPSTASSSDTEGQRCRAGRNRKLTTSVFQHNLVKPTREDSTEEGCKVALLVGKNVGPHFFLMEKRKPRAEVLTPLPFPAAPTAGPMLRGTILIHAITANPLSVLRKYEQELFDHQMSCFLNQNHLGHLIAHIFCLFRVHPLYSLKLSFPATRLQTFVAGRCDPEADLRCQLARLKKSTK